MDWGRGGLLTNTGIFDEQKLLGVEGQSFSINNGQTSCFVGQEKVTHEDLPTADTFYQVSDTFRSLNQHCKYFVDSFPSYIRTWVYMTI